MKTTIRNIRNLSADAAAVEIYVANSAWNGRIHTDGIESLDVELGSLADDVTVLDFDLLDESGYNLSVNANTSETDVFSDLYGDADAKVLVVVLAEKPAPFRRYEIWTDHFEFRFTKASGVPSATADEIWAWYMEESCNHPTLEASFDSIEDAKAAFAKEYADYGRTYRQSGFGGTPLLVGDVAYIEENIYDEDGEFVQSVSVWDYSTEPYESPDEQEES